MDKSIKQGASRAVGVWPGEGGSDSGPRCRCRGGERGTIEGDVGGGVFPVHEPFLGAPSIFAGELVGIIREWCCSPSLVLDLCSGPGMRWGVPLSTSNPRPNGKDGHSEQMPITLEEIFTKIRVIRDDYNKLLQFLIYIFYQSLTKFLKDTERSPI